MERRNWLVSFRKNGFTLKLLVYGTETEMWAYMNSEIGGGDERHTGDYSYSGATEAEVKAAKLLRMPTYFCPTI